MSSTLMTLMNEGGWVMWVLLLFSIATVAVVIERTLVFRRARVALKPLMRTVDQIFSARLGSPSPLSPTAILEAVKRCRQAGGPLGAMLAEGLAKLPDHPDRVEEAMEDSANRDLRRLQRGFGVLVATATTAPLLGFLGTVTGMMGSFQALVDHGMSDPTLVALGIKEALTTTAAGLIVAVPAQLAHQAFHAQLNRIEGELEAAANHLLKRSSLS